MRILFLDGVGEYGKNPRYTLVLLLGLFSPSGQVLWALLGLSSAQFCSCSPSGSSLCDSRKAVGECCSIVNIGVA